MPEKTQRTVLLLIEIKLGRRVWEEGVSIHCNEVIVRLSSRNVR